MKTKLLLAAFLASSGFIASLSAQAPPAAPAAPAMALNTYKDKLSYALGMDIGQTIKRQNIEVDPAVFTAAIRDTLSGTPSQLTPEEMGQILTNFGKEMQAKRQAQAGQAAAGAKAEGEKFLAENKTKEGVKTLPDGLQYKVLKEGTGATPKATDNVSVNYRGTLINGKEFDSSYKRGEPTSFGVNQVIKGWTEGLQLMKVGSKYQFFIPADLAYGNAGAGPDIGPGSTLVFEVELLSIGGKATPEM